MSSSKFVHHEASADKAYLETESTSDDHFAAGVRRALKFVSGKFQTQVAPFEARRMQSFVAAMMKKDWPDK